MTYTTPGKIKYDPTNPRTTFMKWWIIAQIDRELVKYYQHVYYKLHWKKLVTAIWGSHISICRGEEPKNKGAWKRFDGERLDITYEYDGEFFSNGKHVWIKAWAPEFGFIRESLGLKRDPALPYHISIGSIS